MPLLASLSRLSLAACAAALVLSATAEAAETRYAASNGNNNNNCTLNAPCRSLQRAVNEAPDNGEVIVLDSGHFGNWLTITKSITISADSVTATLRDPGRIRINNANAVVVLRGLHLKGAGASGVDGIRIPNAAAVHIERGTIESFDANGIFFTADDAQLFVTDSIVRNNGGEGLRVDADNARVAIDNSRFENNSSEGVIVFGDTQTTITRSISSGNASFGILQGSGRMNVTQTTAAHNGFAGYAVSNGGKMVLESSVARGNVGAGLAVISGPGGTRARVSRSVLTDNQIGISNTARVQTFQNNILRGNDTNLQNEGTIATPAPF